MPRVLRWSRRLAVIVPALVVLLVVAVLGASGGYLEWARAHPQDVTVALPGFLVDAAGVPTHVEHWPAVHPAGLPPLLLVPGFAESTYVWSRVAPLLATDRDVYAYDVRGYGFSGRVGPYTLAADTDQLAALITALGLTRPVVVGHSLGVAVALDLGLRDPTSLSGVVAVAGDGTPYFGADRTSAGGPGRVLLAGPIAPAAVQAVVRHPGVIRELVASRCGPGCPVDDAAIDRWRAPFATPEAVDALVAILRRPLIGLTDGQESAIALPTAVLFSADDPTFDRPAALATAARLHTTAVVGLPGARHLALLGEPDRFAAALEPELRHLSGR